MDTNKQIMENQVVIMYVLLKSTSDDKVKEILKDRIEFTEGLIEALVD